MGAWALIFGFQNLRACLWFLEIESMFPLRMLRFLPQIFDKITYLFSPRSKDEELMHWMEMDEAFDTLYGIETEGAFVVLDGEVGYCPPLREPGSRHKNGTNRVRQEEQDDHR
jgi:hypothetical protein